MKYLDKIIEMSESEFGAIANNGKYKSREEIDSVYKLMDIVKDAMCIMDMEEGMDEMSYDGGMSYERGGRGSGRSYRGGSYEGSYDGGMSNARGRGRNARRDSMGRYAREGGGSYRSYRGYSRDGKEEYVEHLREMMEDAPDDQTRQSLQRMIQQMEQQ